MKQNLSIILASLMLVSLVACAGLNRTSYQATGTSKVSVYSAMTLWGSYVSAQKAAGKPVPVSQEKAVKAAYQKVQASLVAVCDAGALLSAAVQTNSAGATVAQTVLQQAIQDSSQDIADLVTLINRFGVPLP